MDPLSIAQAARDSLGDFCRDDCKAYCCRKGNLPMNDEQFAAVARGKQKQLEAAGRIAIVPSGLRSLSLEGDCPALKDNRCTIWSDPLRPKNCQEFPIFLHDKTVRLSPRCLAVKENRLYPWVAQLVRLGYQVIKAHHYADLDLQRLDFVKKDDEDVEPQIKKLVEGGPDLART